MTAWMLASHLPLAAPYPLELIGNTATPIGEIACAIGIQDFETMGKPWSYRV